jgi:hypothetical protein
MPDNITESTVAQSLAFSDRDPSEPTMQEYLVNAVTDFVREAFERCPTTLVSIGEMKITLSEDGWDDDGVKMLDVSVEVTWRKHCETLRETPLPTRDTECCENGRPSCRLRGAHFPEECFDTWMFGISTARCSACVGRGCVACDARGFVTVSETTDAQSGDIEHADRCPGCGERITGDAAHCRRDDCPDEPAFPGYAR